ncbi:putative amidohydrolase [Rhodopirellula rubra]|uniref:Putative amidohydrolase n=2 Tax=Aporhodopirellula rubra TaxID=980271 RepID=A0A7W5H4B1_9BACT|nr:putative amidohydrolase [Aporhodopirellula rubra]
MMVELNCELPVFEKGRVAGRMILVESGARKTTNDIPVPPAPGFTMLLACVQTDIQFASVRENLKTVLDTLERLSEKGVDLAVFPECMLTGYAFDSREEAWGVAVAEDSDEIAEIIATSKRTGVALTIGSLIRDGEKLHNAALLIAGGDIVGRYHKIHLPHLGVDRFVDRGEIPYQAWTLPGEHAARVGLGICYDISFPEPMRALGLAGADVIALGTNWPVGAFRTAEIVPPARSMENHLFFVAANRIGHERGFDFCGISSICGPDGVELARAKGAEPEILFAEVDLAQARNKRIERTTGKHVIDRFADRQPEFYDTLTHPVRPNSPSE